MRNQTAIIAIAAFAIIGAPAFAYCGSQEAGNKANHAASDSFAVDYSDWWNASSGGWGEACQVRSEITRAQAEAFIVTNAVSFYNAGRDALLNGNQNEARRDFAKAREALKDDGFVPVEKNASWADYSEVGGGHRVYWTEYRRLSREIDEARAGGIQVGDAQNFLAMGQEALLNGSTYQAQLYFSKTDHALRNAGFKRADAVRRSG